MKWFGLLSSVALLMSLAQASFAQPLPSGVISVAYVPDRVVPLHVNPGFAVVVEFAPDEAIDNVIVGNSAVWQVTPNRRGDRLVIKPQANATTTNMVVVTDVRRYIFQLEAYGEGGASPSVLRFQYPPPAPVMLGGVRVTATYRLTGARALHPLAMSDDGERTSISWDRATDLPAIFAVDTKGNETIINGRMVGNDYIVEGVAPRFVFRSGKARATATRKPMTVAR